MKLTLSTTKLQEMMSKSIKGVSNNKLMPLTSLLSIELKDGVLTLSTTDMTNYLFVKETGVNADDFQVTVSADLFAKLIANTTSQDITLTVEDTYLEVKGNGTYKIDIILDEDGSVVKFPKSADTIIDNEIGTLKLSTVKTILNSLKPALAVAMNTPCYTNYFVGNNVVATDMMVINALDNKLFNTEEPLFISAELMDLVGVINEDTISVRYNDGEIQFVTDKCVIDGKLVSYTETYQISDIMDVVNTEFESMCKIDKTTFLQTLDRIALFIDPFSEGSITMTFTKDGLIVSSETSTGTELINYKDSDNVADFVGNIYVNTLKSQIKACTSDTIEIWYGVDSAIKLVNDEVVSIIGLLTEE